MRTDWKTVARLEPRLETLLAEAESIKDNPGRKAELGSLTLESLDVDDGRIMVMGKGGR